MANAGTTLEELHVLLQAATGFVHDIARDDALRRLLGAFAKIPPRDRATIVDVIEREAALLELSESSAPHTGVRLDRLNPHAQLYVRSIGPHGSPTLDPGHERMVHASVEAAKQARLLFLPDLHARWRAALAEALLGLDAETRAAVERLAHELLEALAATPAR